MSEPPRAEGGWAPFVTGVGVGVVVIALLVVSFIVGYNVGESRGKEAAAEEAPATQPATTETGAGAEAAALFQQSCGSCHALAAAGTDATVGPDLDALRPTREQVAAAIAEGGLGTGAMPAGILAGPDAEQVAEYVASVAGSQR